MSEEMSEERKIKALKLLKKQGLIKKGSDLEKELFDDFDELNISDERKRKKEEHKKELQKGSEFRKMLAKSRLERVVGSKIADKTYPREKEKK